MSTAQHSTSPSPSPWNKSRSSDDLTRDWRPTHRITWLDHQGLKKYRDVMLEGTSLFSKTEWDSFAATDWLLVDGKLSYQDQTPMFEDCRIEAFSV